MVPEQDERTRGNGAKGHACVPPGVDMGLASDRRLFISRFLDHDS